MELPVWELVLHQRGFTGPATVKVIAPTLACAIEMAKLTTGFAKASLKSVKLLGSAVVPSMGHARL